MGRNSGKCNSRVCGQTHCSLLLLQKTGRTCPAVCWSWLVLICTSLSTHPSVLSYWNHKISHSGSMYTTEINNTNQDFFFFFENLVVKYLLAYYWTSLKRRNTSTVIGRNWKEDGWKFTKMYRFNDKKPRCFLFSVRKVARLRLRGQVRCQVFVGKIIITKYNSYNYKESLDDSFYNHIYPWQFIVDHNY